MNKLLIIFLISSIAYAQKGIIGFSPLYAGYPQETFTCMRNSKKNFKYQNLIEKQLWGYDRYHKDAQAYAANVGLSSNSVYIPCINTDKEQYPYFTQENQFNTFVKYFQQNYDSSNGDYLWIVIEQSEDKNCQWTSDTTINCGILDEIINLVEHSSKTGIKSNKNDWNTLFGNKCNKYTSLPLHYKNYDSKPDFKDWNEQQFGGWTKPTMKTYQKGSYGDCYMYYELTVY
ncbi:hypothetical protein ABPG74_022601 [Tetrahymena malaccensis]